MKKARLQSKEEQEKIKNAVSEMAAPGTGTWRGTPVMEKALPAEESADREKRRREEAEDDLARWPQALQIRFVREFPGLMSGLKLSQEVFIGTFVNAQMKKDFPLIAHDFLKHEGKKLDEYVEEYYGEDCVGVLSTHEAFVRKIMNAILSAVNHEDEYALRLIRKMYSTYYRKEYRHLKRFSNITYDEMLNFKNEEEPLGVTLDRLMIMCQLLEIDMRGDCSIAYIDIYHSYEEGEIDLPQEPEKFGFDDALYQESLQEAGRICGDDPQRSLKKWRRLWRFKKKALQYLGFDPEWDRRSATHIVDLTQEMAITRSILLTMNPKHHYTDDELQIYLAIFDILFSLASQADAVDDLLNMALGRRQLYETELENARWVSVEEQEPSAGRAAVPAPKAVPADEKVMQEDRLCPQEKKSLTDEIDLLRAQLSSKDEHLQYAQDLYAQARQALRENEFNVVTADDEHNELTTLRDYVYSLTQEDTPLREENAEAMEEALRSRKIVIVGGHANWTGQLREKFPDWEFVKPNVSVMNDPHILSRADRVYFFTDTICHATYSTFIHKVREQHIPFGYIHSTNIKANIRQIWRDLAQENAA